MSLRDFIHPKTEAGGFIRDLGVILLIVAVIGVVLFGVSGTWPALVAVESGSMEPNLATYSLVFVVDENRYGGWMTQEEAVASGAAPVFNGYGDVIVYHPNGVTGVTPIIHRAIGTVTAEEAAALGFTGEAAHAGVITKGDNPITNPEIDQLVIFSNYGRVQPVKEEWIVGKALFAIPLIGWVPLHLIQSILIVAAVFLAVSIVSKVAAKRKGESKNTKGRK